MNSITRFLCRCASHQLSLVMGPVHSSTRSTPWGAYCPAAIMAVVTIQTHKPSLSNQVPNQSWHGAYNQLHGPGSTGCRHKWSVFAQGHSTTPWQLRSMPKTSQSVVAGRSHHVMMPCMYMEYVFGYRNIIHRLFTLEAYILHPRQSGCQHGGRDPGKPAWPEHFSKLAALIINELSLFRYTNNCTFYKCWPNSNSVNMDVICQSAIIVTFHWCVEKLSVLSEGH